MPTRAVTVAADLPEMERLKSLAAALPKQKIRIVSAAAGSAKTADFAVITTLDGAAHATGAKLFTEQLHVVAAAGIKSLSDLQGKVVSFGGDNQPTQAAARKAFSALNISVKETPLDLDNALDGLATGDIDAVVVLAPQPVKQLAAIRTPGLHFISWPSGGSLPDGAEASRIDGGNYPGLAGKGETIPAMGVGALLSMSPRAARQPAAKHLLAAIEQHATSLSKRGFDLIKADAGRSLESRVASVERR